MNMTDLQGQAALYLLGQLPAEEIKAFEERPDHDGALAGMSAVLAGLAFTTPLVPPPASLKTRLLARLESNPHAGLFSKRVHEQGPWKPSRSNPGIFYKKLYVDKDSGMVTTLVKMEPGARLAAHTHKRTEQCLVLEGDLRYDDGKIYRTGDFTWAEAGSVDPVVHTVEGNVLLIVSEP